MDPDMRQQLRVAGRFGAVGLEMGIAVALGAWVGSQVDGHFATAPWGLLGGTVLGAVAGFRGLYRAAREAMKEP